MNFELLIRQYLYQNKSITLPGIGRLYFSPDAQLPSSGSGERAEVIPLQNLQFTYDLQEKADPEFVKFVSVHTGKIAPLASSDVDSHFMLSRQFINIGKAYVIEGVGVIEKKDDGTYGFTPGTYIPVSDAVTTTHKPLKVREPLPAIPKHTAAAAKKQQVNYKNIIVIASLLLLLGLAGWAAYYFLVKNKSTTSALTSSGGDTTVTQTDPSATVNQVTTTTGTPANNNLPSGPNTYKAVFEITNDKERAITRTSKLKAYGTDARIETTDSVTFKLWTPLNAAPSDTLRKRDSLSKFFARKVRLEKL